jgi:outer membrane protein OmpA-like peptidoglycan-associated protein
MIVQDLTMNLLNLPRSILCVVVALVAMSTVMPAQEQNPTIRGDQQPTSANRNNGLDTTPVYKIQVVARDIPAVNYFHRSGSTKIGFQGTSLLPQAKGTAKVEAVAGRTTISAQLEGLTPANSFGPEYLTYVLWAISPEGRPINLGEVLPSGSKGKCELTVSTNLQAFGMIITAEPYFAVTMPSDLVVMQNVVEDRTQGVIEQVNAHYTLLPRGAYAETAGRHAVLHPITRNERSPLELFEAENAVQIATAAGAEHYAADSMNAARTALKNAQGFDTQKRNRKQTITYAREAVQAAEDARIITIRKIKEEDDAAQLQARQNAEQAAQRAKSEAEQEAAQRAQADAQRQQAEAQRAQAEAAAAEARERAERARQQQQAAEQSAQQANQQAEQMRERLKEQLNQVLQTTETARGLIVNMSDVLFDFGKYSLKPNAKVKLAKISGILLAYPNLKLQVEGYTDNVGTPEYNQKLSEERANAVRDFLVSQNVSRDNITASGYGENKPVADNTSSSGRAQNRRVELVVSGSAIGVNESVPGNQSGSPTQQPGTTQPGTPPQPPAGSQPPNSTGVSNPPQQ